MHFLFFIFKNKKMIINFIIYIYIYEFFKIYLKNIISFKNV